MKLTIKKLFSLIVTLLFISTSSFAQETKSKPSEAVNDPSGIKWVSLEDAQAEAKKTGKKVLVFGYADWCTYCMKMRKETYRNEEVRDALYSQFIPVQLNAEVEDEVKLNGETYKSWELARYLRLSSYPTHYFIDDDGTILGAQPGFLPSDIFAPLMSYIGEDQFGKVKFEDYLEKKENIIIEQ